MQLLFPVGVQRYPVYENDKYFASFKSKVFSEVHGNMTLKHVQINIKWEKLCEL